MKNCTYCGRENNDNSVHCRECGTVLPTEPTIARPILSFDDPSRVEGRKLMISGACWLVGGVLVTMLTAIAAENGPRGGSFIVAWGAIFYGARRIYHGASNQPAQPFSEEDAYEALAAAAHLEAKGQIHEALKIYRTVIKNFPNTDASKDANKSIENLKAKLD